MKGKDGVFVDDARHRKALLLGRNDGRSLLWCCNYDSNADDPHGLGDCDVRRMRDALLSREYEVAVVGQDCATEEDVLRKLKQAARECAQAHHFVFYFSGHAVNGKDGFELILAQGEYRESLHSDRLIRILRQECAAASKLVILDCCYAEGVTEVWQPKRYDNLRFLMATKSLVKAKEIADLKGGLFTYCVCDALTNPNNWVAGGPDALVDADGHIFSDRLLRWLKLRVRDVMLKHQPNAALPEPTGDSGQDEPFLIARVPKNDFLSTAPVENRNQLFCNLMKEAFREAFGDIDESLQPVYFSVINDIERQKDRFVLSEFYIEDFFENEIIGLLSQSLEEARQQRLPKLTQTLNKALDDAFDQMESRFNELISKPAFSIISTYFNSKEYARNLSKKLRKSYHHNLTRAFSEEPLLQENEMALRDIYVAPSYNVDSSSLQDDGTESRPALSDNIHDYLEAIFECDDKRTFTQKQGLHPELSLSRLLIFGYPGQGKSSLCKRLAYDIVKRKINRVDNVLLLALRDIPPEEVEEFIKSPGAYIHNVMLRDVYTSSVDNILPELRRCVVILDGLDELDLTANLSQKRFEQILEGIFSASALQWIIVTSRYVEVDLNTLARNRRPLVLLLKGFDLARQKEWLTKYEYFHPGRLLTPEILDKINVHEQQERRLEDLILEEALLEKTKKNVEGTLDEQRVKIKEEEERAENRIRLEHHFSSLLREMESAEIEYRSIEKISDAIPVFEKKYPIFDLSMVMKDVSSKRNRLEKARKRKQEIDQIVQRKLEEERTSLNKKFLDSDSAAKLLIVNNNLSDTKNEIARIKSQIKDFENHKTILQPIRELVSQPLLLYLIARLNIDIEKGSNIISRSAIYRETVSKLAEELFGQIVEGGAYERRQPEILRRVSKDDYRQFIRDLAFAVFANGGEIIRFREASEFVERFNEKFRQFRESNPKFLHAILPTFYFKRSVSGNEEEGAIEFAHKSFREYMAAEHIWHRILSVSEKNVGSVEKQQLTEVLTAGIMTAELFEFVRELSTLEAFSTRKWLDTLGRFFVDDVLTYDFLGGNKSSAICACFFNVLGIFRTANRYDLIPGSVTNMEKKEIFKKMLQLFLVEHPGGNVDVSFQTIAREDLNLDWTNVVFPRYVVNQEAYMKSASFRDFYL